MKIIVICLLVFSALYGQNKHGVYGNVGIGYVNADFFEDRENGLNYNLGLNFYYNSLSVKCQYARSSNIEFSRQSHEMVFKEILVGYRYNVPAYQFKTGMSFSALLGCSNISNYVPVIRYSESDLNTEDSHDIRKEVLIGVPVIVCAEVDLLNGLGTFYELYAEYSKLKPVYGARLGFKLGYWN